MKNTVSMHKAPQMRMGDVENRNDKMSGPEPTEHESAPQFKERVNATMENMNKKFPGMILHHRHTGK